MSDFVVAVTGGGRGIGQATAVPSPASAPVW
jgi:NAD(P)-dependent dehydrogenase (short-subunit alcohol dehydrogenase family)